MIFSEGCKHALRALTYLATLPENHYATTKEISARENLPEPTLAKHLQTLTRAGILTAVKGPGGGFALAVSPQHITVVDVKECFDRMDEFEECAVGLGECSDETPCPLHDEWVLLRDSIRQYLMRTNLLAMRAALEFKLEALKRDSVEPPVQMPEGR